MEQIGVRASFMRGGTSRGLFFRWEDLPDDRDGFLCAAIGAGDPNGRQLDGMGGGVSSLSKAMLVRRSERDGVDVDYLFAQVGVREALVDYAGNCGNLSAAVGVFAVEQGFVQLPDGAGVVRMFNENTAKRVDCHLAVRGGRAVVGGGQEIAGVAGKGAPIRLEFLDPGGARTGRLLPLGAPLVEVAGVEVSFVDAANPCIFVRARDIGLTGCELPSALAGMADNLRVLEHIRRSAAALADAGGEVIFGGAASVPKIAIVAPASDAPTLDGTGVRAEDCDLHVRMTSMGAPHLAIPLTGAMCAAVAARIPGTVVAELAGRGDGPVRIGTPSGVVPAFAEVETVCGRPVASSASVLRTARLLMEGTVFAEVQRMAAE